MSQPLDPASAEEALIQPLWPATMRGRGRNDGATALHLAAFDGNAEVVETLLAHGADPSLRDEVYDGMPAGWAHAAGHENLAKRLAARAG